MPYELLQDPAVIQEAQRAREAMRHGREAYERVENVPPPEGTIERNAWEATQQQDRLREERAAAALERLPPRGAAPVSTAPVEARPEAAVVPEQAHMTSAQAQGAAEQIGAINRALQSRHVVSQRNPMYGAMRDYATVSRASSSNEAEAARMKIAAEGMQQAAIAEQMKTNMVEYGAQVAEARARETVQAEALQREMEAQKRAASAMTQAVDTLASAPDVDPDRYWASKPAGMRFMAALGAGFLGAAGMNPFGHIQSAIQADIEAQRANISKRESVVSGRAGAFSAEQSVYQNLRAQFSDQRAADMAYENSLLELAKQRLAVMQVQSGLPVQSASAMQMIAQIDQAQADNLLQIKRLELANPEYVSRTVSPLSPEERRALEMEREYQYKARGAADTGTVDILKEGSKGSSPTQAIYGERGLLARQEKFGKDVEPVVSFKRAASALKEHLQSGGLAMGDLKTYRLREVTIQALARMLSQGAVTKFEMEEFKSMLTGWTAGGSVEKLQMAEAMSDAKIENARRAHGDDAAAAYFRIPEEQLPQLGVTEVLSGASKRAKEGSGYSVERD